MGTMPVNIRARVPSLPYQDAVLEEVYAGHLLEHLTPQEADEFLEECFRCLVSGGRIGIVVPDTREVAKRYVERSLDEVEYPRGTWWPVANLETLNHLFFYSTVQESGHRWCYDRRTLVRLLSRHGFQYIADINRFHDSRIPVGAWYQCGVEFVKPVE